MIDALKQTEMSKFVIDNGYEWAFIYFRALLFNQTYNDAAYDEKDNGIAVNDQMRFVLRYWGRIAKYIEEIDYDTIAELFESWCNDEAKKLVLPYFTNIRVTQSNNASDLIENTVYLCVDSSISADITNGIYADHFKKVISNVNKVIRSKTLFVEFQKGGDIQQIYQYECWLDAVLLADMHTYLNTNKYNSLGIFIDIMNTRKACWRAFKNTYAETFYSHTDNLRRKHGSEKGITPEDYESCKYLKTELKGAFDLLRTYIKQGRGLIQNVSEQKMQGVR